MTDVDRMGILGRDGKRHRLDERTVPHVYRDDEDNGVATQTEEALWTEIESLREQLRRAVDLVDEAVLCVTEALNQPAHSWHGSDKARRWLMRSATYRGQS